MNIALICFHVDLLDLKAMNDLQSRMAENFSTSARPVAAAAWRGRINIPSQNLNNINITVHVFNKASLKVFEVASAMSESLCLEMIRRNDVWPASYNCSPPTKHSIELIFFSSGRDGEILDNLLNYAITTDFALKSVISESELLIFISLQLPEKLHRFQGKPYFWGIFRKHELSTSCRSDNGLQILTARPRKILSPESSRFSFDEGPVIIPGEHNSSVKADRRGRRLDAAWDHARPLDALRQKAECKHCGFFSSHGGISRLKAHLGGGDSRIHLPGCPKVPPEIKKVMAEWFINWVRETKALWTKEIREAYVDKRSDVPWESAKSWDVEDQKTDLKYIDFTSLHGHTSQSHHEVNIGGDIKMEIVGWPTSAPGTGAKSKRANSSKSFVSVGEKDVLHEFTKSSKLRGGLQVEKRGRPLDDGWSHARPLDAARQKTQCSYCGFISQYGGISRLKTHLGGGSPQMQLQSCPNVPPDVKSAMEQWFNEWAKYSNASWARRYPGVCVIPYSKRGRPPDDGSEHAIFVGETRQAIKCKYCGFVSHNGGIARLRVHLVGGDPAMQLEGCPNVPAELKRIMAQVINKYQKKSKYAPPTDSIGRSLQINEEQWREKKRHYLFQEMTLGIRQKNSDVQQGIRSSDWMH